MPINLNHNKNTIISDDGLIDFSMTGAIKIPLGTTAQQPAGITGRIRFNTTTNFFEGYDGTSWVLIGNTDADTWDGFQFADYLNQSVRTTDTVTFSNLAITNNITSVDSIIFDTTASETPAVGQLSWNNTSGTLNLGLAGGNVVVQVGQEVVVRIYNNAGATLNNGDVIRITGSFAGTITAELADATSELNSSGTIGIVTESILNSAIGYATIIGLVRDIDTSGFTAGDEVWLSTSPGEITSIKPLSPNHPVRLGWVAVSDATEGSIFASIDSGQTAVDVSYDNTSSLLIASNAQSAIDELQDSKASVAQLSSNILLYGTTVVDVGSGYNVSVTSNTDPSYDEPAVDVTTVAITSNTVPTLLSSFISPVGLIDGSTGAITVTSVGNIRQLTGGTSYAYFFAEYYKRESNGTETLLGTSSRTIPITDVTYNEYSSSSLLTSTIFGATDHFVTKLYGLKEVAGGLDPTYDIQVGGIKPARTLIPVPVSVIPSDVASDILLDTSNFTAILSGTDSNVQLALDTIDNHTHASSSGTVVIQDEGVQIDATTDTLNFVGAGVTVTSTTFGEVDITITQTDLGYTTAASTGTVTSSDGTNATLPAATNSLAGLLTGADKTKLTGIETGATADQTAGEIEAIVDHDNLIGFVANEHIDWTVDQGATNINAGNYTDTNTTYVSGDFDHNALTNYVAAEHIDWTLTNAANIHPDNYTDTIYTHPSDGVDLGAALTGANVISDVNVNTAGHVTGFATRAMTASDVGAIPTGDIALGTSTSGSYVQQGATSGNGLSGSVNSEGGTFTISSNATALNTVSTIVYRNASGNFSAGTITAALSGNASTSTTSTKWATGKTITLTGDVTGVSGPFDGSGDISFTTTVANNSHTHVAANITDFDTEVANNSAVTANTAKVSNVTTNLGYNTAASTGTVTSSDGTNATLPAATTSLAGLLTGADKTKLNGIETNATADQTAGEIEALVDHDNLIGFVANEHIDWTTDQGATNINAGNYTDTNTTYVSSDFDHDSLTGFVANEHIDWTTDQGATNINAGNYTDTNTTYVSSDFDHDSLTGFVANEHIDWTTDQGATNINAGNYTDTVYTHPSDGVDLGAALTGANVISDVNVNTAGHVTGFATRAMTASDVGAIPAGDIALGSDTTGNYVATVTGTTNEITVSGSGSETAGVTIGLPNAVTISGAMTAGSFIGDGSGLTNVNAVATSPPGSAVLGDLWYNSESGGLFIYYTDATPDSYWVQVGGADGAGTAGSSGSSPFVDTGTYVYYGGARDVGIGTATPTEALHVIGNILASEDVTAYSDESLKTDISTISGAINIVTQLRGVNYTKKSTQRASIGVIAQEVQKILPSVVHADPETGLLSVAYGNMVGVLIEAIKEQQDEIVELKQQMNDMMKRLDKLDGGN